ncbi:hypothetical protein QCA50_006786 [Cerrena zonata]|uniref:F-box domain-containing protein n=1 Tax=Cerrena zonata TaxID=2478898 RepID=A0AAW0GEX1_9APHY
MFFGSHRIMLELIPIHLPIPSDFNAEDPPLDEHAINMRIESHDAAIHELQRTIAQHQQAIAFYKGSQNLIRPRINIVLPPEILLEIFFNYTRDVFSDALQLISQSFWFPCIKLMHVCRFWRCLILTSPRMFSFVYMPSRNPDCFLENMQYAAQALLDVTFNEGTIEEWSQLLPHIPHTRRLFLSNVEPVKLEFPISSSLTYLQIYLPRTLDSVLDRLFKSLPNLLELHSNTYTLGEDWTVRMIPPNLKVLDIRHYSSTTSSLSQLIDTIRSFVSLKHLSLSGLQKNYQGETSSSQVRFQPLRRVSFGGIADGCLSILSHMESVDELELVLRNPPSSHFPVIETLVPILKKLIRPCQRRPYTWMLSNQCSMLRAWPESLDQFFVDLPNTQMTNGHHPCQYFIALLYGHESFPRLLGHIHPLFPRLQNLILSFNNEDDLQHAWNFIASLREVISLQINILLKDRMSIDWGMSTWRDMLRGDIPDLDDLRQKEGFSFDPDITSVIDFPLGLYKWSGIGNGHNTDDIPFPSLRTLHVGIESLHEDQGGFEITFLGNLRRTLRMRKSSGLPVEKLTLRFRDGKHIPQTDPRSNRGELYSGVFDDLVDDFVILV